MRNHLPVLLFVAAGLMAASVAVGIAPKTRSPANDVF